MDCKDMQKQLSVMNNALDKLDKELELTEKGVKYARSSKVSSAMSKARKTIGKAESALNKGSLPIDMCVEVGDAFEEVRSSVQSELRSLEKHCDSLSWDGNAKEKEQCLKLWRKSVYLKSIKGTGDTFLNGLKKIIWKQLFGHYETELKNTKVALKKAEKELAA